LTSSLVAFQEGSIGIEEGEALVKPSLEIKVDQNKNSFVMISVDARF
jgi:hypothetical protein